jgi:hypothetical protein
MTIRTVLSLLACLIGTSAFAETTKDAIKEFGLVGSWSEDCSVNITKATGLRYTFEAPFFGAPRLVLTSSDGKGVSVAIMQIVEAVRVTEDKIRIVSDIVDIKPSSGEKPNASDFIKGMEVVYRKEASKIRLFETRPVAGQTQLIVRNGMMGNIPTPFFEKCLN